MERATNSSLILYTTEDGLTKIEATFDRDTVWLSIDQMADLFQRNKSTISRHIGNVYKEGELDRTATVAKFATVQMEGERQVERQIEYYNLDVVISVGYRVKSQRGVQFRMWATAILKEFMKKGFVLDDDRLKNLGGGNYFDELLARIRDIRSSEKVFWRKVLEIYATSIDYDPKAESTVLFFKQVQNKMHWAAHQHTAAEVIYQRADAEKEHMGLTSWRGDQIHRADVEVAKNYLSQPELDALNKIVTAYLDIAEVRALNHEPMYMKDWLETIDDYLKMTRREILTTSGHVSNQQALQKAHAEYDKYKKQQDLRLSPVEQSFLDSVEQLEEEGFKGIFVASGAGLPNFMNIPGENSINIMSSNEYLTRVNLMDAASPDSDTPVAFGKNVAVIGGGNTAMDSVRTAKRLGAERAMIIYRRSEEEMPARLEEVKHAKEEGIEFLTLHNPIEYLADEQGRVKQVILQKMELGEPDASGRRSPVPIPGATETVDIDLAIVSVGVSPNPIVPSSIKGLELGRKGTITVNDQMQSSIPTIYAGGDIVRGGATVILAMGDGRRAAAAMNEQLSSK